MPPEPYRRRTTGATRITSFSIFTTSYRVVFSRVTGFGIYGELTGNPESVTRRVDSSGRFLLCGNER
jgi:hypothetical protein